VTLQKLRWLLTRADAAFGDYWLDELRAQEIAAWRMTISPGYRFEATGGHAYPVRLVSTGRLVPVVRREARWGPPCWPRDDRIRPRATRIESVRPSSQPLTHWDA
jgi:hypothetical protein